MYHCKNHLPVLGFLALTLLITPAWGQMRSESRRTLNETKGREILDELQLREAVTVKAPTDLKSWAKIARPESFSKNNYLRMPAEELKAKTDGSPLKTYSTPALFSELQRRAINKGIFGDDDRKDLFRLEAERAEVAEAQGDTTFYDAVLKNAAAVCCLVKSNKLNATPNNSFRLTTVPFSDSQHDTLKLCPLERFFSQPTGAFCTGFLVAPDIVITAGHCVNAGELPQARFIFGYRMIDPTQAVTSFQDSGIYKGAAILGHKLDASTGEDWAIVKLDRPVANVTPVKFRKQGKIDNNADIYVVGFPCGLPCKVSDNARVTVNTDNFVFNGNLDTYGGNSGSPVFNRVTHEVEGILVRGGEDFTFATDTLGGCIRSVVLGDVEGREACTRSSVWASKMPPSP